MRTLLALLALSLAARAGVTIVDPAGGPGGPLLQAAIAAAPSGEILLLKPGNYAGPNIVVSGKVLSLVGDGDPSTIVLSHLNLELPQGSATSLVRGLSILESNVGNPAALLVESPGEGLRALWVEDCTVHGINGSSNPGSEHGIQLDDGLRVVLVRTEARGGDGRNETGTSKNATDGGDGLLLFSSICAIDKCQMTGGKGGNGNSFNSTDGGNGMTVIGYAEMMGCTLQGGDCGNGPNPGKNSGYGLWTFATVIGYANSIRDVVAAPGVAVGGGVQAEAIHVAGSVPLVQYAAVTRSLEVPSPLREGQDALATLRGEAGDAVFVLMSAEAGVLPFTGKQGANVIGGAPLGPFFVTVLPAGGTVQVPVHLPELPPGMEGVVVFAQPYMLMQAGGTVTGAGSAVVWIDAAL